MNARRLRWLAACVPLALFTTVTSATGARAMEGYAEQSIAQFGNLPGDQVVTIPDGTYRGGKITARRPATSGPLKGWLFLVAANPGRAIVDLSGGDLIIDNSTSRLAFVGLRFVGGTIRNYGSHVAYWYTSHSYPLRQWDAEPLPRLHRSPRALEISQGSTGVRVLGSDFADIGDDALFFRSSTDALVEGVSIEDLDYDNLGRFHNDAVQVAGAVRNLRIRDSYIVGRQHVGTEMWGDVDIHWQHIWMTKSPSAGLFLSSKLSEAGKPLKIVGEREDIHSWGHSLTDRIDAVDKEFPIAFGARPDRIQVADTGIVQGPPPPGALNPADAWRAAHPFGSWRQTLAGSTAVASDPRRSGSPNGLLLGGSVLATALLWVVAVRRRDAARSG